MRKYLIDCLTSWNEIIYNPNPTISNIKLPCFHKDYYKNYTDWALRNIYRKLERKLPEEYR